MTAWPEGFAWVVGGSGGLGAAICEALADAGMDIVLTYRSSRGGAVEVAERVKAKGRRAEFRQLNLPDGDPGDLEGCRALVFAAGPPVLQAFVSQVDPAHLERAISVELQGFVRVVQAALPALRSSGGSIVALTSAGLRRHPSGDILSTAPKAGIESVIRGLAREEGRYGVRANAVGVGVIEAGMFHQLDFDDRWVSVAKERIPLGRFGEARDVGDAVVLATQAAYLTGQTLWVDGGYTA
jgi:NAD(P)-dependent dehydrogenase (short-subunit alcohol dehydrogenase family)